MVSFANFNFKINSITGQFKVENLTKVIVAFCEVLRQLNILSSSHVIIFLHRCNFHFRREFFNTLTLRAQEVNKYCDLVSKKKAIV